MPVEKEHHVETASTNPSLEKVTDVDNILEKRAVRKLDWAILPVMTMYYLLSFLVRFKFFFDCAFYLPLNPK